ncbi:MAG TPA: DMT family transporter [Allosphingosinicella sp.]|uniref:DMT family transporter n=1 Tax=Allosphingosinicella sp. TaxID=2823234 RepID=UPI002ED8E38D
MDEAAPRAAPRAGRYAFAALILSNIFLAMGPWMVRLADVGPVASGFWRMALAIPLLLLFAWRGGIGSFRPFSAIGALIALGGFFFAADLAAWHFGIKLTKLANATLFGNTSSLLFPIYGFIVARMLPKKHQLLALLLAMAGAALLLGSSYELSARHLKGDLLAILAGLFYTFYLITIDRARQTLKPMPVLALATIAGAGPLLLFSLALGEQVMPVDWTPLILLSLGSQVIGQGLLVYAMGHLSPLVTGLGLLTQPAVTALVGWLVYDERLSALDGVGAILICAALVLIRLPERREA